MRTSPRLVIFDVIETLFSLAPVREAMRDQGLPPHALDVWFARLLRDAFAVTAAGGYASFSDVASGALATVAHDVGVEDLDADGVLDAFSHLPAYPDAKPALELCAEAGVTVVALTNGAAESTQRLLDTSGLTRLVDRAVSVHDIGAWKPAPRVYRAVLADGLNAGDAALVAVHAWDILGARRAGLQTGWCARLEGVLSPALGPADVTGETLTEVVADLLRP